MFEALRLVQSANGPQQVIDRTFDATANLGHKTGRLYQVRSESEPVFVGKASYGEDAVAALFAGGGFTLPPRGTSSNWEAWRCIERGEPVVFCKLLEKLDECRVVNPRGLEVTNVRDPRCPPALAKKDGDYWIDFPLFAGDRILGKITLHCHPRYNPEDWEFLRILCVLTSGLLEASEAREVILSDVCHHIGTSFAALPALVSSYRQVRPDDEELEPLNQTLEAIFRRINRQVKDTRERLTWFPVELKRTDLVGLIRSAFTVVNSGIEWQLPTEVPSLEADVDAGQFETLLVELIHNAHQCHPTPEWVRGAVTLRVVPHPQGSASGCSSATTGRASRRSTRGGSSSASSAAACTASRAPGRG